jgi:hypothetical protein
MLTSIPTQTFGPCVRRESPTVCRQRATTLECPGQGHGAFEASPQFTAPTCQRPWARLFPASLLLALAGLLAFSTARIRAEDVIVTGCTGSGRTAYPPSSAYDLGTATLYPSASSAVPAGASRSQTIYGVTNTAAWKITPNLASHPGVYRVYVSMGATYNCSTNIVVKVVATSGCALADTNYIPQTEIYTAAFQSNACLNVWTPVAIISNSAANPTITFTYASGASNRWYMDEVRFENLPISTATPARITQILPGNPVTLSGTGPVSHSFALVSSTNVDKALNQWTREQTNTTGTGSFIFSVNPGAAEAKFFRIITQ